MTERIFLRYFLIEIFGQKNATIQEGKLSGPAMAVNINTLHVTLAHEDQHYFILIYDCGGDGSVKSYIKEQRQSLISNGYSRIIGLRDLYPLTDLNRLKTNLLSGFEKYQETSFVVAVAETEAWFIADADHFKKIDSKLTTAYINSMLHLDLSTLNVESIAHPSKTLDSIYQLAGKRYLKSNGVKKGNRILRTCISINCAELYLGVRTRVSSLSELCKAIDSCFV